MIDLTEPIDFDAAIGKLSDKELRPTVLRSDEIMRRMNADLRDRSFFSAQVANADMLQGFKDSVDKIVKGESDVATQRLELKKLLDAHGYSADPDKVGTLQDLRSNQRLNLILKTNTAMVRGYGQYQEAMSPDVLSAFPAQKLIRIGKRKVPRHWLAIWDNARMLLGDATTALPSSKGLIALKSDPIWREISDFGLPWPPFKFNSGMGLSDVDYDEAVRLELIKEGAEIKDKSVTLPKAKEPAEQRPKPIILPNPKVLPMNAGLAASVEGIDSSLLHVLLQMSAGLSLVGTEIMLNGDDTTQNRSVAEVWEEIAA